MHSVWPDRKTIQIGQVSVGRSRKRQPGSWVQSMGKPVPVSVKLPEGNMSKVDSLYFRVWYSLRVGMYCNQTPSTGPRTSTVTIVHEFHLIRFIKCHDLPNYTRPTSLSLLVPGSSVCQDSSLSFSLTILEGVKPTSEH